MNTYYTRHVMASTIADARTGVAQHRSQQSSLGHVAAIRTGMEDRSFMVGSNGVR